MVGLAVLLGVLGAVIGSFVSVVAYRVPREESIVGPRSKCPHCDATIAAYDNIPVVSWLVLRGRCRSCGERISIRYPLVELALAGLYVASYLVFEDEPAEVALAIAFVTMLAVITLTDLERRVIPNVVLIAGAVVAIAIVAPTDSDSLPERAIAAAAAGGLLLVAALAYAGGMGMGDVKLGAVMGLYLGRAVAPALLVGFAVGALVGIGLLLRHGAAARKRAVPFGPFLALGGAVALFVGDELVDWYLDSFFRD
ncbi:MAG TPA: prepilin peptidase [Solirubrobacterales bacterium]|nr:prepilin peptidase [Solirubrobacterales bacterium]